jgi:hypothetical protein
LNRVVTGDTLCASRRRQPVRKGRSHRLLVTGVVLFVAFLIGAGGAAPRYNRIVFGALPLAGALVCFGIAAFLHGSITRRRAWAGTAIGCWMLAAVAVVIWMQPSLAGARTPEPPIERAHVLLTLPTDRARTALFAELQPVEVSGCTLERFGEPHDGGYLMCSNLLASVRAGYSYGIHGYDQWGCDVARNRKVRVHQYDCFDLTRPACPNGDTVFHAECVGPTRRTDAEGRVFDQLLNQFTANGDAENRLVVKMDVEGAEWESLLQLPADVLGRIDQLAVEFHMVGLDEQLAVVRRLKDVFHVAHLHYNNYACAERLDPFPAWAYEVLFVNKRIARAVGPRAAGPHPLDAVNNPRVPDCQAPTSRWAAAIPGALRPGFLR